MGGRIEHFVRILRLAGVAGAVYLAASTTVTAASTVLFDVETPAAAIASSKASTSRESPTAAASPKRRMPPEFDGGHNPFCHDCSEPVPGAPGAEAPADPRVLFAREQATELGLELVATLEGAHGESSLAVVRREETGTVGVYAAGDALASDALVHSIGRGIVHIRHGRQIEFLRFEAGKRERERPSPPQEKKRRRYRWEVPGAQDAISCRNHHCEVDRDFVEELLASPSSLSRQARVRFARDDGRIEGVRLYGIRPRSLPWLLGLRSGDVVLAVGGERLDSADDALRMYKSLRTTGEVELRVRRRGDELVKVFDIS